MEGVTEFKYMFQNTVNASYLPGTFFRVDPKSVWSHFSFLMWSPDFISYSEVDSEEVSFVNAVDYLFTGLNRQKLFSI
ncbi:unnamed protein product [Allacma fusca]|uniref:Uncharacterized protein n=1 Tax=Allacma fusca TaxID=39272 RepID=A0A8J2LCM9_9HEXA|nr:unnamed protein product [Allacma fusca]